MKITLFLSALLILTLCTSCAIEPEEISYGKDACNFCKMAIVETKYGAEIVTKKGKVFKYDAIECMINEIKKRDVTEIGLFLVTDYDNPKKLIDATQATYLICDQLRSPMGANLSAFESKDSAAAVQKEKGGKLFDWISIQKEL